MYECFTGHVIFNIHVREGFHIGIGLLAISTALSGSHRMDNENIHRIPSYWDPVERVLTTSRYKFCRRSSTTFRNPETHATKRLQEKKSQLGIEINVGKTNAMKSIPDPPNPSHLKVVLLRKYNTSSTSGATSVQIMELTNMWN